MLIRYPAAPQAGGESRFVEREKEVGKGGSAERGNRGGRRSRKTEKGERNELFSKKKGAC